jgi:hypothetical protein
MFQGKISSVVEELVNFWNVSGVYIDQLASAGELYIVFNIYFFVIMIDRFNIVLIPIVYQADSS